MASRLPVVPKALVWVAWSCYPAALEVIHHTWNPNLGIHTYQWALIWHGKLFQHWVLSMQTNRSMWRWKLFLTHDLCKLHRSVLYCHSLQSVSQSITWAIWLDEEVVEILAWQAMNKHSKHVWDYMMQMGTQASGTEPKIDFPLQSGVWSLHVEHGNELALGHPAQSNCWPTQTQPMHKSIER